MSIRKRSIRVARRRGNEPPPQFVNDCCSKCGREGPVLNPAYLRWRRENILWMTLREFARKHEVSAPFISDLERGNRAAPAWVPAAYDIQEITRADPMSDADARPFSLDFAQQALLLQQAIASMQGLVDTWRARKREGRFSELDGELELTRCADELDGLRAIIQMTRDGR